MVANRLLNMNHIESVNIDYSDHLAQILWVSIGKGNREGKKVLQRKYIKDNVKKFITMLSSETWEEIYVQSGINEIYNQFLNIFLDYFNKVFPLKSSIKRDVKINTWISKGIKLSDNN
jgi:hypothetical protein